jgi:hypothetical protein
LGQCALGTEVEELAVIKSSEAGVGIPGAWLHSVAWERGGVTAPSPTAYARTNGEAFATGLGKAFVGCGTDN